MKLFALGALFLSLMACAAPAAPPPAPTAAPAPPKPAASAPLAAATSAPATAPTAPTVQSVRTGILPTNLGNAGLLLAQARGYFREQGVELELQNFDGGVQMIAPLAAGQLDVGAGGPGAVLYNAAERDITIKVVGDNGSTPPGFGWQALLVRKPLVDAGTVREVADLRGRKVAIVSTASSAEVTMMQALRRAGLRWDDVDWTTLPFPDMLPALGNGAIDGALLVEPLLSAALASGSSVALLGVDEIYPNQQLSLLMYSGAWATRNPELARGFMVAYVRGVRDYLDAVVKGREREQVAQTLVDMRLLRDAVQLERLRPVGLDPNGRVNVAGMKDDLEHFVVTGVVHNRVDIDALVDMQYADHAVRALGEYR